MGTSRSGPRSSGALGTDPAGGSCGGTVLPPESSFNVERCYVGKDGGRGNGGQRSAHLRSRGLLTEMHLRIQI
jgi:hypothetical protein